MGTPTSGPDSRALPGGILTRQRRAPGQGLVSGLCSPLWPSKRRVHTHCTHTPSLTLPDLCAERATPQGPLPEAGRRLARGC